MVEAGVVTTLRTIYGYDDRFKILLPDQADVAIHSRYIPTVPDRFRAIIKPVERSPISLSASMG